MTSKSRQYEQRPGLLEATDGGHRRRAMPTNYEREREVILVARAITEPSEVSMSNDPAAPQAQRLAEQVTEVLYGQDRASKALGIRIDEVRPGYARVSMVVRADMTNGHRIGHGGMVFTLADTAFAFACNSHNENNVAASASIDFLAPSHEGDELTAVATELWRSGRSGIYEITVTNQQGARIALFRGRSARIAGQVVSAD